MNLNKLQPQELRFNNWLIHNNEWVQIKGLDIDGYRSDPIEVNLNNRPICEYEPIKLEWDIFIKAGFSYTGNYWTNGRVNIKIVYMHGGGMIFYYHDMHLEYLHNLQNIVYDLTGAEIKIKNDGFKP